jgi:hypothetical protein
VTKRDKNEAISSIGIDWISGTCPFDKLKALQDYLCNFFDSEPEYHEHGLYRFERSMTLAPYGVSIHWDTSSARAESVHGGRVMVIIPGEACNAISAARVRMLLHDLCFRFWMLGTRIDLCFDDYERRVSIDDVAAACEAGNVAGFRRWERRAPKKLNGQKEGDSVCLGRRGENGSGKYMRIYDKFLESKGELNCIRWEVEFGAEKARSVVFALAKCETMESYAVLMAALIGGAVDFIVRHGKNLDRADRVQWWEGIREFLGKAVLRGIRKELHVVAAKEWVEKCVVPSLRMIVAATGFDDFWGWLAGMTSCGHLTAQQKAAVRAYCSEFGAPYEYQGAF